MKRFSERSRRGQRRLLILFCMPLAASLFAVMLFLLDNSIFDDMHIDQNEESTEQGKTEDRLQGTCIRPESSATENPYKVLYELILNMDYPYASSYKDTALTENSLGILYSVNRTDVSSIPADQVSFGDIAVCGPYVGICMGRYNGFPLYAYVASYPSGVMPEGGVYLGYSAEQMDQSIFGMRPVPFSEYYDVCSYEGEEMDAYLDGYIASAEDRAHWYEDYVYSYGRIMSAKDSDELGKHFPKKLLASAHIAVDDGELTSFLDSFPVAAECPWNYYAFSAAEEVAFDGYSVFTVNCVSMDGDTLYALSGEWSVSLYQSGEFIPCIAPQIERYVGSCGLVSETASKDHPELLHPSVSDTPSTAESSIKDEMLEAGWSLQDDGTYSLDNGGFSIIMDLSHQEETTDIVIVEEVEIEGDELSDEMVDEDVDE